MNEEPTTKAEEAAIAPILKAMSVAAAVILAGVLLTGVIHWAILYLIALIAGFEPLTYWHALMVGSVVYAYSAVFNPSNATSLGRWLAIQWHLYEQRNAKQAKEASE